MSKGGKRAKSGTFVTGPLKWEQALNTAVFDEATWTGNISFIVPTKVDDFKHIEFLSATVNSGIRRLFSLVSKESLYAQVRELGNPKVKKGKDVPSNFEVCEPCKAYLDANEEIPTQLLAKLLKFKFMSIKQADVKRREAERKLQMEKDKARKDKAGVMRTRSATKRGTAKQPEGREGSKLKKRGEEAAETKCIDDEPDDGAKRYIVVVGFNNPHLFMALADIGIYVNSIIRVYSQDYSIFASGTPPTAADKDEKTLAAEEATRLERHRLAKTLYYFWKDIVLLLRNNPDTSKLHDVARLDYEVKTLMVPTEMEESTQQVQFGMSMFEDISSLMFDLQDARRLYNTYLQNVKLTNVPCMIEKPPDKTPTGGEGPGGLSPIPAAALMSSGSGVDFSCSELMAAGDMRYYKDLMNAIPLESASVPLIMHCMLEQVLATEENKDPPSERHPYSRPDGLSQEVAEHLGGIAFKLALTEEEHKTLADILDLPHRPPELPSPPQLMNVHNQASIRTHHLNTMMDAHPEQLEHALMKLLPIGQMLQAEEVPSDVLQARAARLQELFHFCATNGLAPSEIDRAFKQFVFECMDLVSVDVNGFPMKREEEGVHHSNIPWDDPYPFFKGMIPHEPKPSMLNIPSSLSDEDNVSERSRGAEKDKGQSGRESSGSSNSSHRGILRSRSNTPLRTSHTNSMVHFEVPDSDSSEGHPAITGSKEEEDRNRHATMEVVDAQKRVLDQWCFAEHYEANVLLQVLDEALYSLPFVERYQHRRDESVMLVLHNPYNPELQNHVDWHTELHSNMGFRNYLENVAESIADWLKEKEAEYQAFLLSNEVKKIVAAELEAKAEVGKKGKKSPRGKSAGSRSKSPKVASRSNSTESMTQSNPYMHGKSLKAQKAESERLKVEEEEKEEKKKIKKERPPSKTKPSEDKVGEKEKDDRRPSSKGSNKAMHSAKGKEEGGGTESAEPPKEEVEEKFWPFTGYDMGNQLLHVSGITSTLFPSDGGQIRLERTDFVQGSSTVQTTLLKDGHIFVVHLLNPIEGVVDDNDPDLQSPVPSKTEKTEEVEKAESEKSEKEERAESPDPAKEKKHPPIVSQFGSITATLVDGMVLSLSNYGSTGTAPEGKAYEPTPYIPSATTPVPPPHPPSAAPGGSGGTVTTSSPAKGKKDKTKNVPTPELPPVGPETPVQEEKVEEKPPEPQNFQEVFVTCPDGLQVRYFLQSAVGVVPSSPEDRQLVVRQSYPMRTSCSQECQSSRRPYVLNEASRVITSDGTVVKTMLDGSTEVLYADGTVAVHKGKWPFNPSPPTSPHPRGVTPRSPIERVESPKKSTVNRSAGKARAPVTEKFGGLAAPPEHREPLEEPVIKSSEWTVTYSNGERVRAVSGGEVEELKPVMISIASDPDTKQTMATRDDKVMTVSYPDGTTVVEHRDGTRITVYYRDTQVPVDNGASETGEPMEMVTNTLQFLKVECPAYATVEFNCSTSENLTVFGSGTSLNVFPDGYYILHHARGGRIEIDTESTMMYYPRHNKIMEQLLPERELLYILRHNAEIICETMDPDGNSFAVKATGDFNVYPYKVGESVMSGMGETLPGGGGDECSLQGENLSGENLSGDNLSEDSEERQPVVMERQPMHYGQHAPRFFIIHGDGSGTELLRYQDIAEYLLAAERNPATAVLKEPLPEYPGVVGITILKPYIGNLSQRWLKAYDQASIVPSGIRSRDLTTLPPKEFKKPGPRFGTNVGRGLSIGTAIHTQHKVAILKCPSVLELRQFVQYRPMSEELRESLRCGLKEYGEYSMQRQHTEGLMAVQDPRSQEEKDMASDLLAAAMSQRVEQEPVPSEHLKQTYEIAVSHLPTSPPSTPVAKRNKADWERDQRELAEEAEGLAVLRGNKIPPYFESEMGRAFLLTQAKDMDEMLKQLSEDPRRDGTQAVRAHPPLSSEYKPRSFTLSDDAIGAYEAPGQDSPPPTRGNTPASQAPRNTPASQKPRETKSMPACSRQKQSRQDASRTTNVSTAGSDSPGARYRGKTMGDSPQSLPGMGVASEVTGPTPTGLRPGNPTPAHATGEGSPAPVRPKNPTPAKASKSSSDRPGSMSQWSTEEVYDSYSMHGIYNADSDSRKQSGPLSLKVNVVGQPRSEAVPLPGSIKGGRPNAIPNTKYAMVEDPVRRHVRNTAGMGMTQKGAAVLKRLQGLNVLPEEVNFGVLREGSTYAYLLQLKNTGVDSCRYRVQQPPPATGLRVIYKPGAVAAGMKTELRLELYAIAVGVEGEAGVGCVSHDLEILTETDKLRVPVKATVLTAHVYDQRKEYSSSIILAPGTIHVSNVPPASMGLIKPRKIHTTAVTAAAQAPQSDTSLD